MNSVETESYKGKKIVCMDFSQCTDKQQMLDIIDKAKTIIRSQPLNSVLTMTNVEGARFNSEILEAFKEFTVGNKSYVKHSAIVGIKGMIKIAYEGIMLFSKRKIPDFPDVNSAKDWLVEQE